MNLFRRGNRGYVALLLCAVVPVLMLGVKYGVDSVSYHRAKIYGGGDGDFYKECAREAALAAAQRWNPGLTLNQQKESLLRIADGIYNATPCHIRGNAPVHEAIPGLEISAVQASRGKSFDPLRLTWSGTGNIGGGGGLDASEKIVRYTTVSSKVRRTFYPFGGNQAFYRIMYGVEKDSRFLLKDDGSGNWVSEDMLWDFHPTASWIANGAVVAFRKEYASVGYYRSEYQASTVGTNESETITYTHRTNENDDIVQISIENDQIRVQTDSDIGYAIPAQCNVDIVLVIPMNGAACNKNNNDGSSPTAETPSIHHDGSSAKFTNSTNFAANSRVQDTRATPIYQIAQAMKTFLRDNFEFTRGVNVGLIPYSGKFCIPPHRKVAWTENIPSFVASTFLNNQNECLAYVRGCFLYGTKGEKDANLVSSYIDEIYATSNQSDPYGAPTALGASLPTWWGICSAGIIKNANNGYHLKGVSPLTAIMCRGVSQTSEVYGGNSLCVGDLLSTDDPATSTKFRRMNNNPCYLGYANFLSMKCEKASGFTLNNSNITNGDNGNLSPHLAPPYFLIELQADVGKICDLLNVMGPFWDEHNVSNFIFIPITWANNLFQNWTNDPTISVQNTIGSSIEDGGHLSRPSKSTAGRKKALILIVNKPDWFEPQELTYLGFDNDFSEIPMIESDCIRFDIDYSDTSKKFADGTPYNTANSDPLKNTKVGNDPLIAGPKKILKFQTVSGNVGRNPTSGFYETLTNDQTCSAKLSFPQKYLVKITVAPSPSWQRKDGNNVSNLFSGGDERSSIVCGNNRIITLNSHNKNTYYSDDEGLTWTAGGEVNMSGNVNYDMTGIFDGTKFFSICYFGVVNCSADNGLSWKKQSNTGNDIYCFATNGNGVFLLIDYFNRVRRSTNECTTIELIDTNIASLQDGGWTNLAYGNGRWVAYSEFLKDTVYSTNDGTIWTSAKSNIVDKVGGISGNVMAFGNGKFVFLIDKSTGAVVTSVDGVTWTPWHSAPIGSRSLKYYGNGKWVVLCNLNSIYWYDENKPGSLKFKNVTGNAAEHSISNRTEFYIEPSQIFDTKDSNENYTIQFDMKNIRLVSAEITNRPYKKITPACSLSDSSNTATIITNVIMPLTVNATPVGSVSFYDNNGVKDCRLNSTSGTTVTLNQPYTITGEQDFVFSGSKNTMWTWSNDTVYFWDGNKQTTGGINFGYNLSIYKIRYSTNNAAVYSATLSKQILRYYRFIASETENFILNDNGHVGADSGHNSEQHIDPCIATNNNGKYNQTDGWVWNGVQILAHDFCPACYGVQNTKFIHGSDASTAGTPEILMKTSDGWTNVGYASARTGYYCVHDLQQYAPAATDHVYVCTGKTMNGSAPCRTMMQNFFFVNMENKSYSASATFADVIANKYIGTLSANDNSKWLCFCGDGELKVTVSPSQGTIGHITPTGMTISDRVYQSQTVQISPETHKYVKQSDGTYRITLTLTNCAVSDAKMVSTDPVFEYLPLRLPEMSRSVDFSKADNGNLVYYFYGSETSASNNYVDYSYNSTSFAWNATTERWEYSDFSGSNYLKCMQFAGDMYWTVNVESTQAAQPYLRFCTNPNKYEYFGAGLLRLFNTFSGTDWRDSHGNCYPFEVYNCGVGGISVAAGGLTMPINAVLYCGASGSTLHSHEWQSNSSGTLLCDATAAARKVTIDACAKLKADCAAAGQDLRIYIVKYRKQTQYKHKITGANTDFNYDYVDACATTTGGTTYVYDVDADYYKKGAETADTTAATADANLAKALSDIAANIKSWAGYENAKNVN